MDFINAIVFNTMAKVAPTFSKIRHQLYWAFQIKLLLNGCFNLMITDNSIASNFIPQWNVTSCFVYSSRVFVNCWTKCNWAVWQILYMKVVHPEGPIRSTFVFYLDLIQEVFLVTKALQEYLSRLYLARLLISWLRRRKAPNMKALKCNASG